ncbi:hypothetical protein B0H21DRAFT_817735 [Amylocystis lapponica]|nr:hypothetical protein B0H21DRAFT_817735 [Amylocystis lapponica]
MFQTALRSQLRPFVAARARTFVSTALLTKTWQNETVNDLRKEAKNRGLSPKGNRATLITRLQHDEEQKALAFAPSVSAFSPVRHASTAEVTTEVPGIPSTAPPPPREKIIPVYLPDLSVPTPEARIQIPFVPDLWDSSRIKAESAPAKAPEPSTPKVLAVAGASTHYGGGPSHNLYDSDVSVTSAEAARVSRPTGFWGDLADDLNLPTSFKLSGPTALYDVPETTETSGGQGKDYSRTLDKDEASGLWVLLGLLGGSWLAAGLFKAPSAFAEKAKEAGKQRAEH